MYIHIVNYRNIYKGKLPIYIYNKYYLYVCICMYVLNMNITISIPHEIKVKLDSINNKSGLITRLLTEYFGKSESPEVLKVKRDELQKKMEQDLREIDYKIELQEKEVEQEHQAEEVEVLKQDQKIDTIIKNAADIFDITLTEQQALDYMNGNYETLAEFINDIKSTNQDSNN